MYYNPELLFSNNELSRYFNVIKQNISKDILNEEENYILNVGQETYSLFLKEKYEIINLVVDTTSAYADPKEELIAAEDFPKFISVYSGKAYLKQVFYFHIPYQGNKDLLFMQASNFTFNPPRAAVSQGTIYFRYVLFDDDMNRVNQEFDNFVNSVNVTSNYTIKDVDNFNKSIESYILSEFTQRKTELLKRREQLASLTMPIKKRSDTPSTFSVPSPKVKKKISVKPIQKVNDFNPVPTLNEETYFDILKIINDMGKEFERKPSVYNQKGGEDLRDHYLMMLEPNFEGSATGETFNKSGKTDILLRHQGSNVFVGECKFWTGPKGFLKTIDQLLGYLTWRDSKTAVIMFVNNKDFSNVVKTAKEIIEEHPNFIRYNNDFDDSWSNYTFHMNGDQNNEFKLAMMLYHTP